MLEGSIIYFLLVCSGVMGVFGIAAGIADAIGVFEDDER